MGVERSGANQVVKYLTGVSDLHGQLPPRLPGRNDDGERLTFGQPISHGESTNHDYFERQVVTKDPYKILKVNRSASLEEIKAAYRKLITKHHPDRNPGNAKAEEKFKEVQWAWDLLSDAARRDRFDSTGDSDDKPCADTEVLNTVSGILTEAIGHGALDGDVVEQMRNALKSGRQIMVNRDKELKAKRAKLEKLSGRFKVEGDGDNVLSMVTKRHVDNIDKEIASNDRFLDLNQRCLDFLKPYSCPGDLIRGVFAYGGMGTTATSTSSTW